MKKFATRATWVFLIVVVIVMVVAITNTFVFVARALADMESVQDEYKGKVLCVRINDCDFELPYDAYCALDVSFDGTELEKGFPVWFGYANKTNLGICEITPDVRKINDFLSDIYREPRNAEIVYTPQYGYSITEESNYLSVDVEVAIDVIATSFESKKEFIDLTCLNYEPRVKASDLKEIYDRIKWINDFELQYTDGTVVTGDMLVPYLDEDGNIPVDADVIDTIVGDLYARYQTNCSPKLFKTASGELINISYVTYGTTVMTLDTRDKLFQLISEKQSRRDIEPVMLGYDSDLTTYVEVSIEDQHVWHYVAGELCCESDCVTGTKGRRDTPTGVYYISEKIPGKYLTGADYKTWVNKWMRLTTSGVGLHDAYWRGKFGGDIYDGNGSHGCINLPPKYAAKLYDEVSVGTPTVIY